MLFDALGISKWAILIYFLLGPLTIWFLIPIMVSASKQMEKYFSENVRLFFLSSP